LLVRRTRLRTVGPPPPTAHLYGGEAFAQLLDFTPKLGQGDDPGALVLVAKKDSFPEDVHRNHLLQSE